MGISGAKGSTLGFWEVLVSGPPFIYIVFDDDIFALYSQNFTHPTTHRQNIIHPSHLVKILHIQSHPAKNLLIQPHTAKILHIHPHPAKKAATCRIGWPKKPLGKGSLKKKKKIWVFSRWGGGGQTPFQIFFFFLEGKF